ncbi:hypothetical protein GOBAR_AA10716 [Gossypium barbadense]|uniref:DUF4283 domain-containing protein n=1 Tax=Gossypium barbadense TaxID=3634 RepID=A0A2P5Y2W2_GOSBA|nr:hypothetical protein GOBAR_AA10716 [Gossypium barbadense]
MVRDNMSSSLCENDGPGKPIGEELIPKKVRFREKEEEPSNDMMIELSSDQPTSWRDMLVGQSSKNGSNGLDEKEAFDILEGDIQRTVVNGNKFYIMWRPSAPIHMMDIENGYFLVKFQNKMDCDKVLSEGLWTIFGQYLTVQPWTMAFDPTQAFPSVVMAWIRFLALPSYLYNGKIITEIRELVGKVVKLDMNTDNRTQGRFARMAVYVNLEEPLVSQILINGRIQKINEKVTTALGLEDAVPKQAWNLMDCNAQIEGMQQSPGAPSSCSRASVAENMPKQTIDGATLHVEGEPSTHRVNLILKGADRGEVILDVGSLDSGKHSAVVFFENKEVQPSNGSLVPVRFSGLGKRNKLNGKINRGVEYP